MTQNKQVVKMDTNALLALLQGKELHYMFPVIGRGEKVETVEIVIRPPFDGFYITHEEYDNLRASSTMNVAALAAMMEHIEKSK